MPDAGEIARIRAKHTFLKPLTIPANSYPNQTAAIDSLGSWSFILVRESLPDDVAYHLAKTLHGIEAAFCKKLPQACETTAANTVAAAPNVGLIHPGVMKYFREIGVVKYDLRAQLSGPSGGGSEHLGMLFAGMVLRTIASLRSFLRHRDRPDRSGRTLPRRKSWRGSCSSPTDISTLPAS